MNMKALPRLLALAIGVALASPAVADGTPRAAAGADAAADAAAAREELRAAREELREVTRRIAEISARLGTAEAPRAMAFRYLSDPERAMIGVVFGEGDGDGVRLAAVTPGGPAEKAGLRSGDRVLTVNGKPVRDGDAGSARELVGPLKAGDTVTLGIERDGKRQDIVATAERRESWDWPSFAEGIGALPLELDRNVQVIIERNAEASARAGEWAERARVMAEGQAAMAQRQAEMAGRQAEMAARQGAMAAERAAKQQALGELRRIVIGGGGGFFDLRLADVNPALGKYFGTEDGVLVLDKDAGSLQPIQPGDVILSVGGERTDSSRDVMRALSQRADQAGVNVEVMRDRKRQVLVVDVPKGSDFDVLFPLPPMSPLPPGPPEPPGPKAAPPAPPAPPPPPGPAPSAPARGVAA